MPNAYCNLTGTNKIKDEYPLITAGFASVETDITANMTRLDAVSALATANEASIAALDTDDITNVSSASGTTLSDALSSLQGQIDVLEVGDSNALIGVYSVSADGTTTITGTYGGTATVTLFNGLKLYLTTEGPNTGAVTFNFNGEGAVSVKVKQADGTKDDLNAGDMPPMAILEYDNTDFVLLNGQIADYSTPATVTQQITALASSVHEGKLTADLSGDSVVNEFTDDVAGCEDNSNFSGTNATLSDDTSNELSGTNCMKITLTDVEGSADYDIFAELEAGKYYLISGYVKNGNATNITMTLDTDDEDVSSSTVTATSYNRVGIVVAPTDFDGASAALLKFVVTGTATQYAFVDQIAKNEITAEEYALGASTLLTQKAWHLGLKSTDKTRILSEGKNLFDKDKIIDEFKVSNTDGTLSASAGNGASAFIRITGGGSYKLSGVSNTTVIQGAYYTENQTYISGFTSYTTLTVPANAAYIRFTVINTDSDTAMLERGSTATTYEAYDAQQAISPLPLRSVSATINDKFYPNTGKHVKNVSDVVEIDGSYTYEFSNDYSGFKRFNLTNLPYSQNLSTSAALIFDYTGKKMTIGTDIDNAQLSNSVDKSVRLYISDEKTGWDEAWVGGTTFTGMTWANLIKAYMNGWKLTTADADVANCEWTGIASGDTQSGALGYAHVIATQDTGYQPYRIIYQLASPVTTYCPSATLLAKPSGRFIVEPFVEDVFVYSSGITVDSDYPISSLAYVQKIDVATGQLTPVAISDCTVTGGDISAITGASDGEFYVVGYRYVNTSTIPDAEYSYPVNTAAQVEGLTEQVSELDKKINNLASLEKSRLNTFSLTLGSLTGTKTFSAFVAPEACQIVASYLVMAESITASDTAYWTYTLTSRGSGGTASDTVCTENTSATSGSATTAYDALSLGTPDSDYASLSKGNVLTFTCTTTSSATAFSEALLTIEYMNL